MTASSSTDAEHSTDPPPRPSRSSKRTHQLSWPLLAILGTAASSLIVVAGGQVGTLPGTVPLTTWFGVVSSKPLDPVTRPLPGLMLLGAVVAFTGMWLLALCSLRHKSMTIRRVWLLAACWALPLVLGPPLLSGDVFTYAAQGLLAVHHLDPYRFGPTALGRNAAAAAVDPRWRSAPSPYGPLATALEWSAAEVGRGPLGAVIILRAVATASVIAIGVLATKLAVRPARSFALALTVLNPVVLLQLVSAAHFEAPMLALLLGGFLLIRRHQPFLGIALACVAGAIKAPALLAVGAMAAYLVSATPRGGRLWVALRVALATSGVLALAGALIPDGWGWVNTALRTPALGNTPDAPTWLLTAMASPLASLTHSVAHPTVVHVCQMAGLLTAALIAGRLVATIRQRPVIDTAGGGMLALSLLGPVIYPWYPLWGSLCLAPGATARRRDWLVALSAVTATMEIPGLSTHTIWIVAGAVSLIALLWLAQWLPRAERWGTTS